MNTALLTTWIRPLTTAWIIAQLVSAQAFPSPRFDVELDPTDFLLAARIGYRFVFFDHLTVTPWVGLRALLNKGNDYVVIDGDKFKVSTFNVFPTVHVGWAF